MLSNSFDWLLTDLPFTFGKVFLDLSADRFMDILVQSCVTAYPARCRELEKLQAFEAVFWDLGA